MISTKNTSKSGLSDHSAKFESWFEDLYFTHFERLFRYSFAITKSKEQAEDVVSDVFFNLWKRKPELSKIKDIESYLFVSVKNLSIHEVSKDPCNFSISSHENSVSLVERINPEDLYVADETGNVVTQAVAALPDICGLVFRLIKEERKSHREVSKMLGITEETVKKHIIKALSKIRKALNKRYSEETKSKQRLLINPKLVLIVIFLLFT